MDFFQAMAPFHSWLQCLFLMFPPGHISWSLSPSSLTWRSLVKEWAVNVFHLKYTGSLKKCESILVSNKNPLKIKTASLKYLPTELSRQETFKWYKITIINHIKACHYFSLLLFPPFVSLSIICLHWQLAETAWESWAESTVMMIAVAEKASP